MPNKVNGYSAFLGIKSQLGGNSGFAPTWIPDNAFGFQRDLIEWATRKGRAAVFADCGMGKTLIQLAWAQNVVEHTGRPVLILTPLAVSHQTVKEGERFGVEVLRCHGSPAGAGVYVTNYEQLHRYDATDWVGVVCDESSILKSFAGRRRALITRFMSKHRYRLLCTATAAPNDYTELGTSSEALGYLGHVDMLGRFFKNEQGNCAQGRQWGGASKWRFKGHAEDPFWQWVCSWARAVRRPSDLGYDDGEFQLPPLDIRENVVHYDTPRDGFLFHLPPVGLQEERDERRNTIVQRCERAAELLTHEKPVVAWCHLNAEADLLARLIPGAVNVSGSDSDDEKERKLLAFSKGDVRALVTKPKIGAWGLNWQHCDHHTYFPSHSFEQWYQAVRRSWRFGQTSPVTVDLVTSSGEEGILRNLQRKSAAADLMFDRLVMHMRGAIDIDRSTYQPSQSMEMPEWL